jgi:VIT1/CCC1 family predicted Fe2+/Mn2+ transporter
MEKVALSSELEELVQLLSWSFADCHLSLRWWQVAEELSATDPIRAHARDELGIDMDDLSKPWQACFTSALAFAAGAAIPLLSAAFISVYHIRVIVLIVASTLGFITIGALGAWLGGAPLFRASLRVTLGGWFAMAVTFGILYGFGQALGENTHQTL